MKVSLIRKVMGALHILLNAGLIMEVFFDSENIVPGVSVETLLHIRGTADGVASCNIGIGLLLLISSSIQGLPAAKTVLKV